eukprot:2956507-Pyramimonas_sp.AAC.1
MVGGGAPEEGKGPWGVQGPGPRGQFTGGPGRSHEAEILRDYFEYPRDAYTVSVLAAPAVRVGGAGLCL